MAVEIHILVRFERSPNPRELANIIEDAYADAIILEIEEEEV